MARYLTELPLLRLSALAATKTSNAIVVINRDPYPDEEGVPLVSELHMELAALDGSGIDPNALEVIVGGRLAVENGNPTPGFNGTGAGTATTLDGVKLRLVPVAPFESLAQIEVRVRARTRAGAPLDTSYGFTIEDRTAPKLLQALAIGPRVLRLHFDEAVELDPADVTLEALSNPAITPNVTEVHRDEGTLELVLSTEMSPDVRYRVSLGPGVVDLNDNAILAPYNTSEFIGWRPSTPSRRRFDLWLMLPNHNRKADQTGDLRAFVDCLQEIVDLLLADIDAWTDIIDLERAPAPFVDLILQDLGNPFAFDLTLPQRRRLAATLVEMHRYKGTAKGIIDMVRFFLGLDITIETYADETLVLGVSSLDVDWILGTTSQFARFAFDVRVERILSDVERHQLREIVEYLRPVNTIFANLHEPLPPPPDNAWVLGQSELDTGIVFS